MSYSKSIYFIPVWFNQFKPFVKAMDESPLWEATDSKKVWAGYLFRYASDLNRNKNLFSSYTLKEPHTLGVYMFQEEMGIDNVPSIEEVRFSCFSTGVGFLEFWVTYKDLTVQQIADFAYLFKKAKATSKRNREFPDGKRTLYDIARDLLPESPKATLFFASSAWFKYECNCFHFLHLDQPVPDAESRKDTLFHLSRSYRSNMPTAAESTYDVVYEASENDFWGCCPDGLVNIVYDSQHTADGKSDYYLHKLKPERLQIDYYFMYLLLLNQKYSAVEYIRLVSLALDSSTKDVENLNKRIIQLKNTFSFNIISDDSVVQNVYTRMYGVLEIKNLLADVIENENQMEFLQKAKHMNADRLSNKYLLGISILSLFSALIDSASYFDRLDSIRPISTVLSLVCVLTILVLCIVWAVKGAQK